MHEADARPADAAVRPRSAALLGLAIGLLLLALATGAGWWAVSPVPVLEVRDGGLAISETEQETAVAADGWFAVCAAVAGVLWAVVVRGALTLPRIPALVWVTVAGLVGSLLAWRLGMALGPEPLPPSTEGLADGDRVTAPLRLSAYGVLLTWPLVSVIVLFALTAGLNRPARPVSPPAGSPPSPPP